MVLISVTSHFFERDGKSSSTFIRSLSQNPTIATSSADLDAVKRNLGLPVIVVVTKVCGRKLHFLDYIFYANVLKLRLNQYDVTEK